MQVRTNTLSGSQLQQYDTLLRSSTQFILTVASPSISRRFMNTLPFHVHVLDIFYFSTFFCIPKISHHFLLFTDVDWCRYRTRVAQFSSGAVYQIPGTSVVKTHDHRSNSVIPALGESTSLCHVTSGNIYIQVILEETNILRWWRDALEDHHIPSVSNPLPRLQPSQHMTQEFLF